MSNWDFNKVLMWWSSIHPKEMVLHIPSCLPVKIAACRRTEITPAKIKTVVNTYQQAEYFAWSGYATPEDVCRSLLGLKKEV